MEKQKMKYNLIKDTKTNKIYKVTVKKPFVPRKKGQKYV